MARKIKFDMDSLTLGDLELFEEATGADLMAALQPVIVRDSSGKAVPDPDDPKGRPLREVKVSTKVMIGLVFIALRKENPEVTLDEVKAIPLNDFDIDLSGVKDEDPTEPSEPESEDAV